MASKTFRFVGSHAGDLASGAPVAPGEFTNLTTEQQNDPHNKSLIEEGLLIEVTNKNDKRED